MKKTTFLASLVFMSAAYGYEAQVSKGTLPATMDAMIEKVNVETSLRFSINDFIKVEDLQLATSRFEMYVQAHQGVPVSKTAVRIWSDKSTQELILAELHISEEDKKNEKLLAQKFSKARFTSAAIKSKSLARSVSKLITEEIARHKTDSKILGMKSKDVWVKGDLVREVEVRSRRGLHIITISLLKNKVTEKSYTEFPQSESFHNLKANVYPIYEEVEATGEKLPYEVKVLKYINASLADVGESPLAEMASLKFPEELYNPILSEIDNSFWSETSLRKTIEGLVKKFPLRSNDLGSGMLLQGKYVTINLHPAASKFTGINFDLKPSVNHIVGWFETNGFYEAKPISGLYGKLITSEDDLLHRIPVRLIDHDAVSYINSGVDEVQVYYGVTVLMEALGEMGFEDPELSTKPFHAFLYDPDISMKDNAYYYDNTINFTTYSPTQTNLARDNPTIWHELGHGVMDRLMGPHLGFEGARGGYGGLSEGMADFIADIVVEHQTSGAKFPGKEDFRINNNTGFYLTNEYHDDGEAYGGAMGDMLDDAIAVHGREGLYDFADLTLEAMRLTRNHPALSPKGWYEHMLYADSLGSEVRTPGQFKSIIEEALKRRNFGFSDSFKPGSMTVHFEKGELTSSSPGSRDNPIVSCGTDEIVTHNLKLDLKAGEADFIKFPATVKVEFKKGALQGAIKWLGEEANPTIYTVASEGDILDIPLSAHLECETINQPDGSCKDYAYLQIFNQGSLRPVAKKRFYLKLNKAECIK